MLVAILEITVWERRGCDQDVSEVMMGRHGVWSQSKPRAASAEGPSLAKVRGSGRMPRHSQGPPPGTEQRGKEVKLLIVKANRLNTFQLTVH